METQAKREAGCIVPFDSMQRGWGAEGGCAGGLQLRVTPPLLKEMSWNYIFLLLFKEDEGGCGVHPC